MAAMVTHLRDLMAWSGYPAEQIFAQAGLNREDLSPRSGRIHIEAVARLLHAALDITKDPQLLLKLSKVTFNNGFGVLGYLAPSCPQLKDAIDNLIRFGPLMSNIGHATLEHEPGLACWTLFINHDDPVVQRQGSEYLLGVGYRFLLLADAKRSEIVHEVRFTHAPPASAEERAAYADVLNCPVRFNAPHTAIVLNAASLSVPLRQADVSLKEVVVQQAERKLNELDLEPAFPAQVRRELQVLILARQASREALAERLGVSSRHLGRQLANAGLGYRDLVDEIRLDIARNHLLQTGRTVADIGELLGFADGQSFIRWFRGVTGKTPGDFRLQQG